MKMIPGEYFISEKSIIANQGRKTLKIQVKNTGDRPVQVGSHTHFFEVNKALAFFPELINSETDFPSLAPSKI